MNTFTRQDAVDTAHRALIKIWFGYFRNQISSEGLEIAPSSIDEFYGNVESKSIMLVETVASATMDMDLEVRFSDRIHGTPVEIQGTQGTWTHRKGEAILIVDRYSGQVVGSWSPDTTMNTRIMGLATPAADLAFATIWDNSRCSISIKRPTL